MNVQMPAGCKAGTGSDHPCAQLCYRGMKQKQGDLRPLTPHPHPHQTPTSVPRTSYHQLSPNYLLIGNSSLFKGILQRTNRFEDLTLVSSPPEEMGAFVVKFKLTKAGPGKEAGSMLDKLQLQHQLPKGQLPPGTFDESLRKTASPSMGKDPGYTQREASNCSLSPFLLTVLRGFQNVHVAV